MSKSEIPKISDSLKIPTFRKVELITSFIELINDENIDHVIKIVEDANKLTSEEINYLYLFSGFSLGCRFQKIINPKDGLTVINAVRLL